MMIFFFNFSQKTGFDITCKLSPMETICMKCLNLFSGKHKKKYIKMSTEIFTQIASRFKATINNKCEKASWLKSLASKK